MQISGYSEKGLSLILLYVKVRWKTRSAECGVRSAECGKCGVWKMRSVENEECEK